MNSWNAILVKLAEQEPPVNRSMVGQVLKNSLGVGAGLFGGLVAAELLGRGFRYAVPSLSPFQARLLGTGAAALGAGGAYAFSKMLQNAHELENKAAREQQRLEGGVHALHQ